MQTRILVAALSLLWVGLALVACNEDDYTVRMQVQPEAVTRTVEVRRHKMGGLDDQRTPFDEELAPLRRAYGPAEVEEEASTRFGGTFSRLIPDDVGGFGTCARLRTSLGELVVYTERFRGQDDILAANERRMGAVDVLVDIVLAWSKEQYSGRPGSAELFTTIDTTVRHDVQSMMMLTWTLIVTGAYAQVHDAGKGEGERPSKDFEMAAMTRLCLYMIEHGYLEPEDEVEWFFRWDREDQLQRESGLVLGAIAHRLRREGHDRAAALLEPLSESAVSLMRFAARRGPSIAAPWFTRYRLATPSPTEDDDGADYLPSILGMEGLGAGPWLPDQLDLSISAAGECLATNGTKGENGEVSWKLSIDAGRASPQAVPAVASATFASPNEASQRQLFGKVALTGKELAEYCAVVHMLKPAERDRWEKLLPQMRGNREQLDEVAATLEIDPKLKDWLVGLIFVAGTN